MVQVGGLATGLDVNTIVTSLVSAEISPAQLSLDRREAAYQSDVSALGTLKSALNEFKTALENLDTLTDLQPRSVTNSNSTLFSVSADDTAVEGSYDIQVVQLAEEHQLLSGTFDSSAANVGTGSLTITRGTDSFTIDVAADAQTLDDVRDAINNASDNPGVRASIVNVDDGSGGTDARLFISSGEVGSSNALTITAVDDDGNNTDDSGLSALTYPPGGVGNVVTQQQQANDAVIRVFGQDITRSTNTISDAITGVTIDLLATTSDSGDTGTATIALDKPAVTGRINDFVTSYNTLVDTLGALGDYDDTTQQGGVLLGDATLRSVQSGLRRELSSAITDAGLSISTLAEIGITTQRDGRLSVDSTELDDALTNNFDDVGQLFASESGYATRLTTVIDSFAATDGSIDSRIEGINSQLTQIGEERVDLEDRAILLERRFTNQFTALDLLVSELNTISSFLAQNLASLPGFSNQRSS